MFELLVICEIIIGGVPTLSAAHILDIEPKKTLTTTSYLVKVYGEREPRLIETNKCQYVKQGENE